MGLLFSHILRQAQLLGVWLTRRVATRAVPPQDLYAVSAVGSICNCCAWSMPGSREHRYQADFQAGTLRALMARVLMCPCAHCSSQVKAGALWRRSPFLRARKCLGRAQSPACPRHTREARCEPAPLLVQFAI